MDHWLLAQVGGTMGDNAIIGVTIGAVVILARVVEVLVLQRARKANGEVLKCKATDDVRLQVDELRTWKIQHGERIPGQLDKIGEAALAIASVLNRSQEIWKEIHGRTSETRQDVSAIRQDLARMEEQRRKYKEHEG